MVLRSTMALSVGPSIALNVGLTTSTEDLGQYGK